MSEFDFSASKLPLKLFINNEYVDSKDDKRFSVYNPKNEKLVSDQVPCAGERDVDEAVAAAEAAFPAWRKVPAAERREILMKFAALIENHVEPLAELTRVTLGAPYGSFGKFEAGMAAEVSLQQICYFDTYLVPGLQVQCRLDRQIRRRGVSSREWIHADNSERGKTTNKPPVRY